MPEFYSIAIYRLKEYKKAGVPLITVIRGIEYTKRHIIAYTLAFTASSLALFGQGYTGYTYLVVMGVLNLRWVLLSLKGLTATQTDQWAKQMFRFSLIVLIAFSALISLETYLP